MVSAHAKATHDDIERTNRMSIRDIGRPRLAKRGPRHLGIDAGAVSLGGLTLTSGAKQPQFNPILNKFRRLILFIWLFNY